MSSKVVIAMTEQDGNFKKSEKGINFEDKHQVQKIGNGSVAKIS